jgi:hypothetical protein
LRIAEEFGYQLVIDHGTEAHLLADILAAKGDLLHQRDREPPETPFLG